MDDPLFLPYQLLQAPLPPPTVAPDSLPLTALCFATDWLPYVLGALKILTVPELYDPADPDAVNLAVQYAEQLIDQAPHECGDETVIPWCGESDFSSSDHSDIWTACQYDSRGTCAWDSGNHGYFLHGTYGTSGVSQLCVIKVHFASSITVTGIRVFYQIVPISHIGASTVFAAPTNDCNDESVYVQSSGHAPDFNGDVNLSGFSWTGQDFVIRVQADADDPGHTTEANLIIKDVIFFGTGDPPAGVNLC